MRISRLFLAFLALTAGIAAAQQELPPSPIEGPMAMRPERPVPDAAGVYSAGPGIQMPLVIQRVPAVYPADAAADAMDGVCVLSMVIGADGVPAGIQVVTSHGAAFDAAAVESIRQSKFEAGSLDGTPVPVRVYARLRFFADARPAFPRLFGRLGPNGGLGPSFGESRVRSQGFDKPPVALYAPAAEYSERARAAKINGVVVVSVLVNEDGSPTDVRVDKSAGYGLDEKAVECVSRYRFKPATKDGVPVAARIVIEVSFRLY
jgi:TonB family protein